MMRSGLSVNTAIVMFGLFVGGTMLLVMWRHRSNQAQRRFAAPDRHGQAHACVREGSSVATETLRSRTRITGRSDSSLPARRRRARESAAPSSAEISRTPVDTLGKAAGAKRRFHRARRSPATRRRRRGGGCRDRRRSRRRDRRAADRPARRSCPRCPRRAAARTPRARARAASACAARAQRQRGLDGHAHLPRCVALACAIACSIARERGRGKRARARRCDR